jgi:hypothetical protein
VVLMWRCCHDLAQRVGKAFDSLRPLALLLLLQLLTAAATAAVDMQKAAAVAGAAAAARVAAAEAAVAAAASDSDDSSSSSSSSDGSRSRSFVAPHHRRSGSSSSYGVTSGPRSALGDISAASDSEDELHGDLHAHSQSSLSTSQWALGTWGDQLPGADSGVPEGTFLASMRRRHRGSKRGLLAAPVSDEAIQAQAWLPHLLHDLLHYASNTAKQVR